MRVCVPVCWMTKAFRSVGLKAFLARTFLKLFFTKHFMTMHPPNSCSGATGPRAFVASCSYVLLTRCLANPLHIHYTGFCGGRVHISRLCIISAAIRAAMSVCGTKSFLFLLSISMHIRACLCLWVQSWKRFKQSAIKFKSTEMCCCLHDGKQGQR